MGHFSPCVQALSVTEAAETTMSLPRAVRSSGTRSADSLAGTETRARSSGGQLLVVPAAVPGSPLTPPPGAAPRSPRRGRVLAWACLRMVVTHTLVQRGLWFSRSTGGESVAELDGLD